MTINSNTKGRLFNMNNVVFSLQKTPLLIELTGFQARQTSKEQTKMRRFRLEVHDRVQSFVLRSYTMHELRTNQHVSIG